MRIVYVIEKISCKGGLERIITDKINYLAEQTNNELVLLTIWNDNKPDAYKLSNKVKRLSLDIRIPSIPSGYIFGLPQAVSRFNKTIANLQPDITVFFRAMGAFLIWQSKNTGKTIYESHLALSAMNHTWIYPFMEKKVDAVVSLTKGDAKEFKHAKRVETIPNFSNIQAVSKNAECLKRCIAVGRLSWEKNFSRLIDLWSKISKTHFDWHLDIFGEGEEYDKLQKKISSLELDYSIHLCGHSDNIANEYSNSDILLMTSEVEGLPMTLIEAQTCGLPCIAFNCHYGPADIIINEKTGYLIPYNEDETFINKLSELMENEELRKSMSQASKDASNRFNKEQIMNQWQVLFSSLVSPL